LLKTYNYQLVTAPKIGLYFFLNDEIIYFKSRCWKKSQNVD